MSIKKVWGKLESSTPSQGIGNTVQGVPPPVIREENKVARTNLILRALQLFFGTVMLLIAVWMATFQHKWTGSPSGLTGLLLFLASASVISSAIFLVVPIIFERSGYRTLKGLTGALSETRVGLVSNGFFALLLLFVSAAQTISAYTSAGCKDPTKDPHAGVVKDKDAFIKSLDGWCRTKRAEAAFCWFLWVAWFLSLMLFLRQWKAERKNGPRIPPITHSKDNSAFEPIDDLDEEDMYDEEAVKSRRYGDGGDGNHTPAPESIPPSDARTGANPLADIEARYGMRPSYTDPFADRAASAAPAPEYTQQSEYTRPSYDYSAYRSSVPGPFADPFAAAHQQHRAGSVPPGPPPLSQGYGQR